MSLPSDFRVLAIETSCDETAASIVRGGTQVLSSVVSSQINLHERYGGVVPEIASRAHLELLTPVIAQTMVEAGMSIDEKPDAVAATVGPGLIGALLVGVSAAKALSLVWDVPFVGVNHLEAHLYASFIEEPDLKPPLLMLLVSGGHTLLVSMTDFGKYEMLGETIDDAAGEAYDKVARLMGLGYPGGPAIDKLATEGDPHAIAFPRAMKNEGYTFSFSGLKTAVMMYLRKNPNYNPADVAASFQEAVVDVLLHKTRKAAREIGANGICLAGGVAANSLLRTRATSLGEEEGIPVFLPTRSMCTDNAAMVGSTAFYRLQSDGPTSLSIGASPSLRFPI